MLGTLIGANENLGSPNLALFEQLRSDGGLTSVETWTCVVLGLCSYITSFHRPTKKLVGFPSPPVTPVTVPAVRPLETGGWDYSR